MVHLFTTRLQGYLESGNMNEGTLKMKIVLNISGKRSTGTSQWWRWRRRRWRRARRDWSWASPSLKTPWRSTTWMTRLGISTAAGKFLLWYFPTSNLLDFLQTLIKRSPSWLLSLNLSIQTNWKWGFAIAWFKRKENNICKYLLLVSIILINPVCFVILILLRTMQYCAKLFDQFFAIYPHPL